MKIYILDVCIFVRTFFVDCHKFLSFLPPLYRSALFECVVCSLFLISTLFHYSCVEVYRHLNFVVLLFGFLQ